MLYIAPTHFYEEKIKEIMVMMGMGMGMGMGMLDGESMAKQNV